MIRLSNLRIPLRSLVSNLAVTLTLLLWGGAGLAASWDVLVPVDKVEEVPVGKTGKMYMAVTDKGVKVPVVGPGVITGFARVAFPDGADGALDGLLEFTGVPNLETQLIMTFVPSTKSSWGDERAGKPSSGIKFTIEVPEGEYLLEMAATLPGGDPMLVILYYEGPPQPHLVGKKAEKTAAKKAKTTVSFVGNASIDFMYNDNILTNSPDDIVDFESGAYPFKFINGTTDDLVIAPAFDIEARSRADSLGTIPAEVQGQVLAVRQQSHQDQHRLPLLSAAVLRQEPEPGILLPVSPGTVHPAAFGPVAPG